MRVVQGQAWSPEPESHSKMSTLTLSAYARRPETGDELERGQAESLALSVVRSDRSRDSTTKLGRGSLAGNFGEGAEVFALVKS